MEAATGFCQSLQARMIATRARWFVIGLAAMTTITAALALEATTRDTSRFEVRFQIGPGHLFLGLEFLLLAALGLRTRRRTLRTRRIVSKPEHDASAYHRDAEERIASARADERQRQEAVRTRLFQRLKHEVEHPVAAVQAILAQHARDGHACTIPFEMMDAPLRRVLDLLDELKQLAGLDQAIRLDSSEPVDMVEAITAAAREAEEYPEHAGRRVLIVIDHSSWSIGSVPGNSAYLRTLLKNLIDNALKYSPPTTAVAVEAREDAGRVVINVVDRGRGIAIDEQEYVFEELFRGRDAKLEGIAGQGLGLAMARRIAALHGGTVTIQSRHGIGTRATVTLPLEPPGLWHRFSKQQLARKRN
jgi:signal transduction histidine kinase